MAGYYNDKIETLKEMFGDANVTYSGDSIVVRGKVYPIIEDVIILSDDERRTPLVKSVLGIKKSGSRKSAGFAQDIQYTFGSEWMKYDKVMAEHEDEFDKYFDIVDLDSLKNKRVCDLGCGNGRWSYFLADKCRELVLLDFSDAIFVARKNLAVSKNCIFVMCDIKEIPFKEDFADFLICLGVLHHLPTPCLEEVRNLKKYAEKMLIFLYYALDNRPLYFRVLLKIVNIARMVFSKIRWEFLRSTISLLGTFFVYLPLVYLGKFLDLFSAGKYVPLYDFYKDRSVKRIEQDVYDRFFTRIEQRVSRKEINGLSDTFSKITISDNLPFWHFVCKR